jgi:hypothetical protein
MEHHEGAALVVMVPYGRSELTNDIIFGQMTGRRKPKRLDCRPGSSVCGTSRHPAAFQVGREIVVGAGGAEASR